MMKIIISPAKAMVNSDHSFPYNSLPRFLDKTEYILAKLKDMSPKELQDLWKCNDEIAKLNIQRLSRMELDKELCAAILAYDGIQYQNMRPAEFNQKQLTYVQEHLRILSGFYGLLKPLDGVRPYRLEMQAKLSVNGCKDLYAYWADTLAQSLFAETDCIINLASKEYSKCISKYLPHDVKFISCVFGEEKDCKVVEKGTMCKIARGEMVRWLSENCVEEADEIKNFSGKFHSYSEKYSDEKTIVFIKK